MAIRRTPFDEMNRMMNDMRAAMFGDDGRGMMGEPRTSDRHETHVSVEADDEGYVVAADLPGFDTEEIDLRFDDGMLLIEAEHEAADDHDDDTVRMHSFQNRRMFERVRLPGTVLVDEIDATYTNGVLEVHVPTQESIDDSGTVIDIN